LLDVANPNPDLGLIGREKKFCASHHHPALSISYGQQRLNLNVTVGLKIESCFGTMNGFSESRYFVTPRLASRARILTEEILKFCGSVCDSHSFLLSFLGTL